MNKKHYISIFCVFCLAFFLLALDDYYSLSQGPLKWEGFWPYLHPKQRQMMFDKIFMGIGAILFFIGLPSVIKNYRWKTLWVFVWAVPAWVLLVCVHLWFIFVFGPILG